MPHNLTPQEEARLRKAKLPTTVGSSSLRLALSEKKEKVGKEKEEKHAYERERQNLKPVLSVVISDEAELDRVWNALQIARRGGKSSDALIKEKA